MLLFVCSLFLASNSQVSASTLSNYGVTEKPVYLQDNSVAMPNDRDIPSSVWNIVDNGGYSFKGSAYNVNIYSNYKFTGKTTYTVSVHNSGTSKLSVKAKTRLHTYGSTEIAAGEDGSITFSTNSESDAFYVQFSGSAFSGSVK